MMPAHWSPMYTCCQYVASVNIMSFIQKPSSTRNTETLLASWSHCCNRTTYTNRNNL